MRSSQGSPAQQKSGDAGRSERGASGGMSKTQPNLQDSFLNRVTREGIGVVIYMLDGTQLRGTVKGFDNFTVLLEISENGRPQLVYKHAVASILPARHLGPLEPAKGPRQKSRE